MAVWIMGCWVGTFGPVPEANIHFACSGQAVTVEVVQEGPLGKQCWASAPIPGLPTGKVHPRTGDDKEDFWVLRESHKVCGKMEPGGNSPFCPLDPVHQPG